MTGLIGLMITLLIFLIIGAVLLWCARQLLSAWSIPQPISTTVYVILVLLLLLIFLGYSGVVPMGTYRMGRL